MPPLKTNKQNKHTGTPPNKKHKHNPKQTNKKTTEIRFKKLLRGLGLQRSLPLSLKNLDATP